MRERCLTCLIRTTLRCAKRPSWSRNPPGLLSSSIQCQPVVSLVARGKARMFSNHYIESWPRKPYWEGAVLSSV